MHARALLLVLGAIAASPSRAAAQPADAQSLFDQGRRLLDAGKIAEACTAFDASQRLDPRVTTELNVAACREQNGELATASAAYREAVRIARAGGDARLGQVAINHAQRLDPRLSRLTISVPPDRRIPGLAVLRDNEPVDPASWDRALPVDGGSYAITARAPGYEPWSTTQTIKGERDAQTVVVPRLVELRAQPVAPESVPSASAADHGITSAPAGSFLAAEPPAERRSGRSRIAPIVLGVAALALGGTGLGFELRSETRYDRARTDYQRGISNPDGLRNQIIAAANSLGDSAVRDRYIAQGLAVAAIGCASIAVYLLVRSGGERRSAAAVVPAVSSGLAGAALVGRW